MTITCPACHSENNRILYRFSAEEAAQTWIAYEKQPAKHAELAAHIKTLWQREYANKAECKDCTFGFGDPFIAGDGRFYELAFGPSNYPRDKWEYSKTMSVLESRGIAGKVLELGSGYGYFLEKISPKFVSPSEVTSVEYNPTAREILSKQGYRVLTCDLNDLVAAGDRYNAIFMYQVLEHRDRVHDTFEAIANLLDDHGSAFIAVPSPARINFWEETGAFMDYPPNHVGFWNKRNLEDMARRHGLVAKEIAEEPFSMSMFMKWDAFFSYTRSAQLGQFPASSLYQNRRSGIGRYANLLALIALSPRRIPVWIRAYRQRHQLAAHIWVHLGRA